MSENDDGYLEHYTSKSEALERQQREREEQAEYSQFDHPSYYEMGHHQPDGYPMYMQDSYQGNHYHPQPMMSPNPPMSAGNFHPSMSPNIPQHSYGIPQSPVDYHEDDGSKLLHFISHSSLDMQYMGQYQMTRHHSIPGQPEEYPAYGNGY